MNKKYIVKFGRISALFCVFLPYGKTCIQKNMYTEKHVYRKTCIQKNMYTWTQKYMYSGIQTQGYRGQERKNFLPFYRPP